MKNNAIAGIITDGDIRRMMEKHNSFEQLTAKDIMGRSPRQIESDELAINALEIMRSNNITQLVVSDSGVYKGIIHLHDLLKEGIL